MMENAVYSVLSLAFFASILWKDSKKAAQAAEVMKMTAKDLLELHVVDQVIPEPVPACAEEMGRITAVLDQKIGGFLSEMSDCQEKNWHSRDTKDSGRSRRENDGKMKPLTIGDLGDRETSDPGRHGSWHQPVFWPSCGKSRRRWNHFHGPDRVSGAGFLRKTPLKANLRAIGSELKKPERLRPSVTRVKRSKSDASCLQEDFDLGTRKNMSKQPFFKEE